MTLFDHAWLRAMEAYRRAPHGQRGRRRREMLRAAAEALRVGA